MSAGGHRVDAQPPYYAVIFTSLRSAEDDAGYALMARRMVELASTMDGFLGIDSAREDIGIIVSYWRDLDAIVAWKSHAEHLAAQGEGRRRWYDAYRLRIAKVERDYAFMRGPAQSL